MIISYVQQNLWWFGFIDGILLTWITITVLVLLLGERK